ncbi:MAG: bifunctional diaminohydroxyphosphoribosylaminopyrimidine deaminase/5-amino-6-(5-phosphoribosylamino)uracil reductase RibD [Actinomycetota bacterium]
MPGTRAPGGPGLEVRVHGEDERYIREAIALARSAPFSSPNPQVGAVLVRAGEVVARAAHRGAGTDHAERAALAGADARGATLYVNLEPCAHHGRTPPCAPAVADAGVVRVVSALEDPDPRVAGRGHALLRRRGVEVTTGVLEDEARRINAPYLHHRATGRPLVTLKLALTLDGYAAAPPGANRRITGPEALRDVHGRRARVDAILVGAGTVLADDPRLTARGVDTTRQPARVFVDASGRVPATRALFAPGTVIAASVPTVPHEPQIAWKEAGAEVLLLPVASEGVDLGCLLDALGDRGFLEVYCEGGPALATSLLRAALVDRLELYYGPVLAGGGAEAAGRIGDLGIDSLAGARRWVTLDSVRLGDDVKIVLGRP